MKDKGFLIVLSVAVLAFVIFVVLMLRGMMFKRVAKEENKKGRLPTSIEKYYRGAELEETTAPVVESASDLESLTKEIDSTSVNFDSDLQQLDKDFASF